MRHHHEGEARYRGYRMNGSISGDRRLNIRRRVRATPPHPSAGLRHAFRPSPPHTIAVPSSLAFSAAATTLIRASVDAAFGNRGDCIEFGEIGLITN
jgi:hypothetical protein